MIQKNTAIERTLSDILEHGIILCVRLSGKEPVLDSCMAAIRGGLYVLEVTLTTPNALEVIRALSKEDNVIVGAGTVLKTEQVKAVADAGGRFALSPVYDPEILEVAEKYNLLGVPGAASPKEISDAHRGGAKLVKVFPAGVLGGPDFLRAVRGPFPHIPLVPTSGPRAENIKEYMSAGAVAVGVGKDVFPNGFTLESA
ncbi:MAG: bifunctional 4-hydroxy-2-oxoglutarate aldolase/2-dehydro-3-deoxy-phosphogluconate aldolase, partial [Candidatus Eisenbacteria bacterium]|nr:bifunctional 4-hydroxy-2-oxoglutarate aldolase/2-dehydro-3-deoxy-phosphogluconate aldolase [Candidatus Eisenbacteria bacterium]